MQDTQEDSEPKRQRSKWLRAAQFLIGAAILAGIVILVFHVRSFSHETYTVIRHFKAGRLPWLVLAAGAEALSFLCYAFVQRNLLMAGGARLTRRDMARLAVAATGLTNLLPGGTAPSSGWLVAQYRKRGVPMPLALWAVLAGGFAATVSVLLLTLVGAAIAGLLSPVGIVLCAMLLIGGSIAFVAGARHLDAVDRWLQAHIRGRFELRLRRISQGMGDVSKFRTRPVVGAKVLALSIGNWGLDVVCLVAAFPLLGLGVPWRTVLFAYALAQIAGSLAPVPGGIGFVEGGMVGAFVIAGTPVGDAFLATIVYRIITSLGIAALGSGMLLYVTRRKTVELAALSPQAAALEQRDST